MPAQSYVADVAALAHAVAPLTDSVADRSPAATSGVYLIEIHIRASDIRRTTAVQQALQLGFDAATIAVLHPDAAMDEDAVADLLGADLAVTLLWAGSGSLRQVFIVNPLTTEGRENIRMIFAVGFAALSFIPGGGPFAGGGFGPQADIGREVYRDLKAEDAPRTVERLLKAYLAHRASPQESFLTFARRHDGATLRKLADAEVSS